MARLISALVAVCATLVAAPLTAHADTDDAPTWALTVDGPSTVASGGRVPLLVERDTTRTTDTVSIYQGMTPVRDITVIATTRTYRAIVEVPTVTKTQPVTYRLLDADGHQVASVTITVNAPARPKVGPNGFTQSAALSEKYMLGPWRWSPCKTIPVRVTSKRLLRPTRLAVRDLRALTGLRLRVTTRPLKGGYGIVVKQRRLDGRVAGLGGPRKMVGDEILRGSAQVDLHRSRGQVRGVVMHEIAHALGVGHSHRHSGDIMSPYAAAVTQATAWDRAALRYAGQGAC